MSDIESWSDHARLYLSPVVPPHTNTRPSSTLEYTSCNFTYHKYHIPSVGVEPTTLGLLDPRSNQLSYEGMVNFEDR